MPIGNSRISSVQANQSSVSKRDNIFVGYVYDVVLDEDNTRISSSERKDTSTRYVGAIYFRTGQNSTKTEEDLDVAYPSTVLKTLPTKNEIVLIKKNASGTYFYERTGFMSSPNNSSSETTLSNLFSRTESPQGNSSEYSNVQQTGITRGSSNNSTNLDGFGEYFEETPGIHKLRLFEGDTLVESRFGQSLRFSGYNNPNNVFSPTIILRNAENPSTINADNVFTTTVEEDVNRDGSIIVLGSDQYKLPFQPGTVDENGNSDFETLPDSFRNYPSELLGNQLLLNSGRVIISAKNAEMIFYSKKNYGFISDGGLSIDNAFGIDANVNDNINITTNDFDVNINSGNGKINLGDTSLEPLVKGDTLVNLLSQLVDAITQQVYLTPSGPTGTGPTNLATFNKIKNQLNTMLSELNSTS
jgi:hypothetical protein